MLSGSGAAEGSAGMDRTARRRVFHYDPVVGEIHVVSHRIRMPRTKGPRIATGVALVAGGCLGFLPVLGFWMIPVGLLVLSQDISRVRRWRRSLAIYVGRKWPRKADIDSSPDNDRA